MIAAKTGAAFQQQKRNIGSPLREAQRGQASGQPAADDNERGIRRHGNLALARPG